MPQPSTPTPLLSVLIPGQLVMRIAKGVSRWLKVKTAPGAVASARSWGSHWECRSWFWGLQTNTMGLCFWTNGCLVPRRIKNVSLQNLIKVVMGIETIGQRLKPSKPWSCRHMSGILGKNPGGWENRQHQKVYGCDCGTHLVGQRFSMWFQDELFVFSVC